MNYPARIHLRSILIQAALSTIVILSITGCATLPNSSRQTQTLSDGVDPQMEITRSASPKPPSNEDSRVISSDGTSSAPLIVSPSVPGFVEGSGGSEAVPELPTPSSWITYKDPKYGFTIQYPDSYVILPESAGAQKNPKAVYQVRFQDKNLAEAETADLEPAQLAIEVYEYNGEPDLQSWIKDNQWLPVGAKAEPVKLAGAREGFHVVLATLQFPNEAYYFLVGEMVFRIVPAGYYAPQMIKTLKLGSTGS